MSSGEWSVFEKLFNSLMISRVSWSVVCCLGCLELHQIDEISHILFFWLRIGHFMPFQMLQLLMSDRIMVKDDVWEFVLHSVQIDTTIEPLFELQHLILC